jgi:hypothetical protein
VRRSGGLKHKRGQFDCWLESGLQTLERLLLRPLHVFFDDFLKRRSDSCFYHLAGHFGRLSG